MCACVRVCVCVCVCVFEYAVRGYDGGVGVIYFKFLHVCL